MTDNHQNEKLIQRLGRSALKQLSPEQSKCIGKWLRMLAEHYQQQINEAGMLAYYEGLRDLTVSEMELGFAQALKECAFIPKVADVRNGLKIAQANMEMRKPVDCNFCHGSGWYHKRGWPEAVRCTHDREPQISEERLAAMHRRAQEETNRQSG